MNYVVHSIMYAYFGATSVSKEWRRAARPFAIYITLLQLSQMVVGIVVTVVRTTFPRPSLVGVTQCTAPPCRARSNVRRGLRSHTRAHPRASPSRAWRSG